MPTPFIILHFSIFYFENDTYYFNTIGVLFVKLLSNLLNPY